MTVVVHGLRELNRAFVGSAAAMRGDLRDVLEESAQPVRRDAQSLAGTEIRNVAPFSPWSRMRVGVSRTVAYVAPVERGVKGRGNDRRRRPNLGDLLMDRAMQPALDRNVRQVERRFEELIDEAADVWEHA